MDAERIKQLIEQGLPGATAIVTGGEGKYEATVISPAFEGMNMVREHQLVYATVNDQIQDGSLHALTIKAYTPQEWRENQGT